MKLALILLGLISFFEILVWVRPVWIVRKYYSCALIIVQSLIAGYVFGILPSIWTCLILLVSVYRNINLLRIVQNRTQNDYLFRVTRKTSLLLICSQILILGFVQISRYFNLQAVYWVYILLIVQLVATLVILASTLRHLVKSIPPIVNDNYADKDLPTLTVAIPARNETEDLGQCLTTLAASTYPKLEILVLDDCSQNKRTPEIIRSFAQQGIRFIEGIPPKQKWLAKNYAYKQLADQANGEIILFCGVDTRFKPQSLRAMVECLLEKKKTMISIIPRNNLNTKFGVKELLIQPSRYAWELSLPRRLFNRPGVLSTCWLITTDALNTCGGFDAVERSTSPESYFALKTANLNDGYSLLHSSEIMGLVSVKGFYEQRATAIRTRYPQLHRRPEMVLLTSIVELLILVGPVVLLLVVLFERNWALITPAIISVLNIKFCYVKIVNLTYRRFVFRGVWLLSIAAVYDVALLNYSMWQFEFSDIIWKGRNICLPVMRVIASLPKEY